MTVDATTITSEYDTQYDMYFPNAFILKIDSLGEGLWAKGFEGVYRGVGIVADGSDNVYVTGYFNGTADFDGITLTSSSSASDYNTFILKTDSLGTVEWAEKFDSGNNYGRGTTLGLGENIYVSGSFSETVDFGGTSLTAVGGSNIFLVKMATDGNLIVEQNQLTQYKVYPNPVKDILTLEIDSKTEATVELFNLLGQKIMEFETINGSKNIDLSNLTTGIYLLKVNNNIIKIKKQ